MSQVRSTGIVKILEKAFAADPELKQKCVASSKAALQDRYKMARIFDNFPCLLEEEYIESLGKRFIDILKKLPANIQPEERTPADVSADIEIFEKEIAGMACAELLDFDGRIDAGLATLLGWNRKQISQLNICCMLCAYVGAINATIQAQKVMEINEHYQMAAAKLGDSINKNYARWTFQTLKSSKKYFDAEVLESIDPSMFKEILLFPIKHPVVGLALGGLAFAAIYGGFKLFSAVASMASAAGPSSTEDAAQVKSMIQQRK